MDGRREDGESRVERLLAPYFTDSTLWPVMLVVLAHPVIALALAILIAVRMRGVALAALGVIVLASIAALVGDLRRGRFGLGSRVLLAVWVLAVLAAWGADRSGLY